MKREQEMKNFIMCIRRMLAQNQNQSRVSNKDLEGILAMANQIEEGRGFGIEYPILVSSSTPASFVEVLGYAVNQIAHLRNESNEIIERFQVTDMIDIDTTSPYFKKEILIGEPYLNLYFKHH